MAEGDFVVRTELVCISMKSLSLIFLFFFLLSNCGEAQVKGRSNTYLSITIPQRSGLAFVDFRHYTVKNDSLFVLYQPMLDTTGDYKLLEVYPIDIKDLRELESLLAQTDSLGQHIFGSITMGWPRFLIHAKYQGKELDGYVANCYRDHIFIFVDWLNRVYPKGDVISYNKFDLLNQEKD